MGNTGSTWISLVCGFEPFYNCVDSNMLGSTALCSSDTVKTKKVIIGSLLSGLGC